MEVFFNDYWNNWIYKGRYFIIAIVIIWTGIAGWRASLLTPLTESEDFLPPDHELIIA